VTFTVNDARDLIRLLTEHPEWRAELRPLILTDELLSLPDLVRQNTLSIELLTADVTELRRAVEGIDQRLLKLERGFIQLDGRVGRIESDVAELKGQTLEFRYERHIASYLSRHLRRIRNVTLDDLDLVHEALQSGRLSEDDWEQLGETDILLLARTDPAAAEVAVAVEVSNTIDLHEIERARRRADVLQAAGYQSVALVAGRSIDSRDRQRAVEERVAVILGGRIDHWPQPSAA
jgi:hypothetical protein